MHVFLQVRVYPHSLLAIHVHSVFQDGIKYSGYILILLSIEYILASLIEMCQGQSRMRNVK